MLLHAFFKGTAAHAAGRKKIHTSALFGTTHPYVKRSTTTFSRKIALRRVLWFQKKDAAVIELRPNSGPTALQQHNIFMSSQPQDTGGRFLIMSITPFHFLLWQLQKPYKLCSCNLIGPRPRAKNITEHYYRYDSTVIRLTPQSRQRARRGLH